MAEEKEQKNRFTNMQDSKFWKTLLLIAAVFLTFAGPTYVAYALIQIKVDFIVSMVSGFALFFVGAVLMWYLIKNKVIS